ncbi:MAG: M1 family metallopeptidase [Bacteroidota bacterium]
MPIRFALALVALLVATPALAQLDETNGAMFAPLDLPDPNGVRAANGAPGPDYWQQRADYRIAVALDTTTHRVSGTVAITYTNNSPHDLDVLWLHLEQNLFADDSRGAATTPAGSRWRGAFNEGGFKLADVQVSHGGTTAAVDYVVTDTRMRILLDEPLLAEGGQLTISMGFGFAVPPYGADRMGIFEAERGTVYEFAQWYPKVAVFDDVAGWNHQPYLGQGEFYLGYGDFDLELTVPSNMLVVATGALTNKGEVYTPEQQARLAEARTSEERVYIVAPDEVGTPAARPMKSQTLTWRFDADNVRDVAWAASAAFILDGAGYTTPPTHETGAPNDVLVLSAYPHEGIGTETNPGWEEATEYGRFSIVTHSEMWYPYPYPVAINVAGIVGGMEYPMLHFSSVNARDKSLFGVVDHELGHNWFPMIVGSDERRHAWMDEGFNSFLGVQANERYYDDSENARVVRLTRSNAAASFMQQPWAQDQAMATYPDQIRRDALGFLAYRKPAKGLLILRDHVLGPDRFDPAFKAYIQRWAYKHPQPADFFRTIEDVAGEDLDWFWRGWVYSTETFDAAITGVAAMPAGGTGARVENRGGLVFPIDVQFTFADGSTDIQRIPVEAFYTTDTVIAVTPKEGAVTRAELDPGDHLPDTTPRGNVWTAEDAATKASDTETSDTETSDTEE